MKQFILPLIACLFIQCSTSSTEKQEVKQIVFEKLTGQTFKPELICQYIPLETKEQNLIGAIEDIKIVDDKIFLLEESAERKILVFDLMGQFICQIGRIGQGPGEFNIPSQLLIDSQKRRLIVCDLGKQRLIFYDLDNYNYLFHKETPSFSEIIWFDENCYAYYSIPGHDSGKRKKYYLMYNEENEQEPTLVDEVNFYSHYIFSLGFSSFDYNNNKYITYPFDPVIRQVGRSDTSPIYKIHFGQGELPSMDWIIAESANDQNYIPALSNSDKIAAFTLNETDSHIQLLYLMKNQFYIGFYNKEMDKGWDCSFFDFVRKTGLTGLGGIVGTHGDYFISYLYPRNFKYRSEMREDLKSLTEKMTEEDNPVLCLFKFI